MSDTRLVRIAPTNNRRVHVIAGHTFEKSRGWYKVSAAMAEMLSEERMSDIDLTSPKVFEVIDESDAKQAEKAAKEETALGTVGAPNVLVEAPPAPAEPPPPAPARVGRRATQGV